MTLSGLWLNLLELVNIGGIDWLIENGGVFDSN